MPGIITIAQGEKRYIEMAKMLALSLSITNPGIERAVITDAADDEFDGLYDIYIPYNKTYGEGLSQKLYLDKYSPFDETFFIDADCLVFNSLEPVLALCKKHSFVVFGDEVISTGEWYMDVAYICKKFNLVNIPLFNGGTYYFTKTDIAYKIYNKARELKSNYIELGFKDFRGSINEEPLIAVAMAINNTGAVNDNGTAMRTPIGLIGPLKIDILKNTCLFNKEGVIVEPVILHFSGGFSKGFHYKREIAKLKAFSKLPFLNKAAISNTMNFVYNIPYAFLVFFKRIVKILIRKEKFDFNNPLPAFSNQ